MKTIYVWVIRSKEKKYNSIWGDKKYGYFAKRTSIKNPQYVSNFYLNVKLFVNKKQAEEFFFKKSRYGYDVSEFKIIRKKLLINKRGYLDYEFYRKAFR